MKKRKEQNRQKNKIKQIESMKWIRYAKHMCVFLVVMILLFTGYLMILQDQDFSSLIKESPYVTLGFIIAAANLFIWYALNQLLGKLKEYANIEFVQISLILMAVSQIVLMNFISAGLLIFGSVKCFVWQGFSASAALKEVKKEKMTGALIGIAAVLIIFILLFISMSYVLFTI